MGSQVCVCHRQHFCGRRRLEARLYPHRGNLGLAWVKVQTIIWKVLRAASQFGPRSLIKKAVCCGDPQPNIGWNSENPMEETEEEL